MYKQLIQIEKKKSKILLLVGFVLILTAFGKLVVSSTLAGRGQDLAELESRVGELSRQNREIKETLASSASIAKIASQSAELGLARATKTVYVELGNPVAQAQNYNLAR
ncbi:MAG: hypothetical protein Q7S79_02535 [bacterium]|nr:hypothetical protein [bacterium]